MKDKRQSTFAKAKVEEESKRIKVRNVFLMSPPLCEAERACTGLSGGAGG